MRIDLTFAVALGALLAMPAATFGSDAAPAPFTLDLSAQQNPPPPKKGKAQTTTRKTNRATTTHRSVKTNTRTRNVTTTHTNRNNVTTTRSKTVVTTNKRPPRQVTFHANRPTVTVRARSWQTSGRYNYRGRNYTYWRHGPWRHRYGDSWRTYVALTTLAAIAVGSATYYPYAYLDVPADYCEGITEDGCQLSWTEVETLEGGLAPACVTYCPWQ
jgi:hypothetical protein